MGSLSCYKPVPVPKAHNKWTEGKPGWSYAELSPLPQEGTGADHRALFRVSLSCPVLASLWLPAIGHSRAQEADLGR